MNFVFPNCLYADFKPKDPVKPLYGAKMQLPIDSSSGILFYYGYWNDDILFKAMDFKVVVVMPSTITPAEVHELRKGHDGISGTDDDVIVLGYLSLGEENDGSVPGNGRGPCYYEYSDSSIVYENKGYASWYVDDRDKNGKPDVNPSSGSYYVNAGDSLLWQYLKTNPSGADDIIATDSCDGLFLDTIDNAEPVSGWPYRWTTIGMSNLVRWLYETYPNKYLVANRGFFYFDSTNAAAYPHTIRPYISGDLFESYYLEPNRTLWAARLNHEAQKPDGFKMMALDYFDTNQTATINQQMKEVFSYNWADYISSEGLYSLRYDVFHDIPTNPPTWDGPIGITDIRTSNNLATLEWGSLTDPSLPLRFDIYYSTSSPLDTSTAMELQNVNAVYDSASSRYSFTVAGLTNYTKYYFLVRVKDVRGNFEKNFMVMSATPPNVGSTAIIIDGNFSDWQGISPLTPAPSYPCPDSDADIINVWATSDTSNLYLSYQVAGIIDPSEYYYHIFIDIDPSSTRTGYVYADSASIGAEYMIENEWLFSYAGSSGSDQWSWTTCPGMEMADSAGRAELSIPLNVLLQNNFNRNIAFILEVNQAVSPFAQVDMAPANYKTQFYQYEINGPTAVRQNGIGAPSSYSLDQNYPNPFNPSTVISYQLPVMSHVTLKVYDVLGREVKTLVDRFETPGKYDVSFEGNNLPSGIYFYRLQAENFVQTKKLVLIK